MKYQFKKATVVLSALGLMLGFASFAMAGEFDGTWKLKDTNGKPFEVTLNSDGTASGTLEMLTDQGSWKEDNGSAVIQWKTGWTTKITKKGKKYIKSAFKPGIPLNGKPTNTSEAKKSK